MKNIHDAMANRPYHNMNHLIQMRDALAEFIEIDEALEAAINFHDLVYEAGSTENEKFSADIAADLYPEHAEFLVEAIMATKQHKATGNRKIDLFLDADMSILGMPWPQYDAYRKAVRKEYLAFGNDEYRSGRMAFLESFSGFITEEFNAKYLEQAKYNINRELNEFHGIFVVIKPRGTSSVLRDTASGIEPVFMADCTRRFTWEP